MNKRCSLTEKPPLLLRIYIDDISNVEPTDTNILPEMKEWLLDANIRIAKDNTYIVMPATGSCILSISSFFSIGKALIETGDVDIQYYGGEEALNMYYEASSYILYWDISHTNRVGIFKIHPNPSIQEKVERSIINALGSHIIFCNEEIMLMDAHVDSNVYMGKITRICDMLSYEMSPNPHIQKNSFRYESSWGNYYILICKI